MILRSLRLRNFRLHADSTIEFDRGVTGIIGTNGEGKSSVLEGLSWCLFGARALRGSKSGIRWHGAPARHVAEAELEFDVGGLSYRLWRSESDAKLFLGDAPRPIAESTSGVDARVPEILGMDLAQFEATYLTKQKELARIADMRGQERRTFFLNVMGVGRIVDAQKALRERKNALRSERDGMALGLGEREPLERELAEATAGARSAEEALAAARRTEATHARDLADAEAVAAGSGALAEQHDTLRLERDRLVREIERDQREIQRLTARRIDAEQAKGTADVTGAALAQLPNLRRRRDELREALVRERRRREIAADVGRKEAELAYSEEMLSDARREVERYDAEAHQRVQSRLQEIERELNQLGQERAKSAEVARSAAAAAAKRAETTERKIAAIRSAGVEGACPTCLRELREAYDVVLENLESELSTLRTEGLEALQEAESYRSPSDEEMELAAARDAIAPELRELEERHEDAVRARQAAKVHSASIAQVRPALETLRRTLDEIPAEHVNDGDLAPLQKEIDRLEALERDPTYLEARRIAGQIPEVEADLGRLRAAVAEAERSLETVRSAVDELLSTFDPAQHEQNLAHAAAARQRHATAREALVKAQAAVESAAARVERAEAALAAYNRRAESLQQMNLRLADYEEADARMSDFRLEQASTIRPEMEELLSGLIATLTDGRFEACSVNEDFEVTLYRNGQAEEVISGGEEDIVALAQRIATSQMISERAGHPLSLLILDEPFGHLDGTRLQNVLALIRRLGGVFEQVLVISHLDEVKESVDRSILVQLDPVEGRSRVFLPAEVQHA